MNWELKKKKSKTNPQIKNNNRKAKQKNQTKQNLKKQDTAILKMVSVQLPKRAN